MAFRLNSDRQETENKSIRFPVPLIEERKIYRDERLYLFRLCDTSMQVCIR